jgi:hypothetical protein
MSTTSPTTDDPAIARVKGRKRADSTDAGRKRAASIAHSVTLDTSPALSAFIPETSTIDLTYEEVSALANKKKSEYGRVTLSDEEVAILAELEHRVDRLVKVYGSATVKLATRAPRDVLYETVDHVTLALLSEELAARRKGKGGDRAALTENDEVEAFLQACNRGLVVTTGRRAMDLLSRSTRVFQDLLAALEFPASLQTRIQVQRHIPCPLDAHFRIFVHHGKLTAITQFFDVVAFPSIVSDQGRSVKARIEAAWAHFGAKIPQPDYIADLLVLPDRILVADLHPFTALCNPGLFSWKADRELLMGQQPAPQEGYPSFRFREHERANVLDMLVPGYKDFILASRKSTQGEDDDDDEEEVERQAGKQRTAATTTTAAASLAYFTIGLTAGAALALLLAKKLKF